jgi:thymidylate synthase (FAD)
MQLHSAELNWITPDAEKVIARHARVSTENPERNEYSRLLEFCIRHGHWSVFEQASASFEISTNRALSPQLLRHRSFTFQEFSQRYSDPIQILKNFDTAYKFDLRTKGETNRQSSTEQLPLYLRQHFWDKFEDIDRQIKTVYAEMLELGIAKECARNILPLYTPTRLHMSGTIRSFIHYVGLRGREDTQLEHRQIAHSIGYCLNKQLPTVINAVKNSEDTSLTGWCFLR